MLHPKESQMLSCWEAELVLIEKWKGWDLIFHTRAAIAMWKGSKHMFATFENFTALDMYIYVYVHGLFPVHLPAKQIHSRWVRVHNKQSLVQFLYVCVRFSFDIALFCLIKVKIVCKWSEMLTTLCCFPVFRSDSWREQVWMTCLSEESLFSVLSSQNVFFSAVKSECVSVICCCGEPIVLSYSWLWTSNVFGKSYWCSLLGENFCWFSQLCFCYAWYPSQLESRSCYLFEFRVM